MKKSIMQIIKSNEKYSKVTEIYDILAEKYGHKIVVGGGCLVDCFYDKEFYDVDSFICVNDLKDEWKEKLNPRGNSHIVDVLRDEINGYDIDIVVVDYSVAKHIRRFDQCFKQIWFDHKGLHMTKQAAKDIVENKITINMVNGPVVYFRVIKSARKYHMTLDDTDMWLLENFMSCLDTLRLSEKYAKMRREFLPYKNPDDTLGYVTYKYTQNYWNTKLFYAPSWKVFKLFVFPKIMKHNLNK